MIAPTFRPPSVVRRVCRWALPVALGWMAVAESAEAETPATDYFVRTWTTDDGLPHNSVNRVVQDATGFLWFATVGGLARFDGREFRELHPPADSRAVGFNIRGLAEESPGILLVVSTNGLLARLSDGAWSPHPLNPALEQMKVGASDLHVDARRHVWAVIDERRLVRWSSSAGARVVELGEFGLSRGRRVTFAGDPAGNLWVGGEALVRIDPDGQPHHDIGAPEPHLVGPGREGRIWACTDRELLVWERGRLTVATGEVPWAGALAGVRYIYEDHTGVVWIATSRRGLFRFAGGRIARVAPSFSSASFVCEDREGSIWVASDGGGVGQLREQAHQLFDSAAGLEHETASALAEGAAGGVWVANRAGGIVLIQPDGTLRAGPRGFVNTVQADTRGRLWYGGGGMGLQRWPINGTVAPETLPVPEASLHALFCARNGDMWFAAGASQFGFYREDTVRLLTAADGFAPHDVRAITQDAAGHIWAGCRDGTLVRWDGTRCESFTAQPGGLPRQPIHALLAGQDGPLWIATAAGLVVMVRGEFRVLTTADGLLDDIIQQIVEDEQGRLWFAARRGFFFAQKSELLTAAFNRGGPVSSHVFGRNHGLTATSPTPNYQPGVCRTPDGRLWFATAQGALVIDPLKLPRDLPPPPVLIDEVRFDGAVVPTGAGPLRFSSGRHRLEFRIAALSFTAPEHVLIRHQLEGIDAQWLDPGSDRIARYTNLPPGGYRLRVKARNSAGQWNTTGAELAFTVVPAWWETTWFRVGAILLLAFGSAVVARALAQRRLKAKLRRLQQEHALEKERARIARDLHDDLGASLTEVGLLADRLVGSAPADLAPALSGLAWRTRRLATELSGIVWTMSAQNSSLDRLADFLRRYADRLFRNTGTRCDVTGVESIPVVPLPPESQHQLLAAAKETINNILKHARATEARIALSYADGTFELLISDNGVGFDPVAVAATSEGNGLRNLQLRMEEVGGSLTIASAVGAGTRVTVRLAVAAPTR